MTPDAVLAYHSSLEFHGRAYSTYHDVTYLTHANTRPITFRGDSFRGVTFPKKLVEAHAEDYAVESADRAGMKVRVTQLERTLVDVLDRPSLSGGWEEIWRSLESIEHLNLEKVVQYALLLSNATTTGKVGFYLEQHREALMVEDQHLDRLRTHRPHKPHYMDRPTSSSGRLVTSWNLVVPVTILERSWKEVR